MGIVRRRERKSTECHGTEAMGGGEESDPAVLDRLLSCKNLARTDALKACPAHTDEPIPGGRKRPAPDRRERRKKKASRRPPQRWASFRRRDRLHHPESPLAAVRTAQPLDSLIEPGTSPEIKDRRFLRQLQQGEGG
jgi:hypothetical protein